MRLYEYEGKILAQSLGIPVPRGQTVKSWDEAKKGGSNFSYPLAVKAQVLSGGRGKRGGIKFCEAEKDLEACVRQMLSARIDELEINSLLIEEKVGIEKEYYVGITTDENQKKNVIIVSASGGINVEDAAASGNVRRHYISMTHDLPMYKAKEISKDIGFSGKSLMGFANIISRLYRLYKKYDATLAEINPLALAADGSFAAVDMRVDIDDDALFRQGSSLVSMGIQIREERGREPTPLEMKAKEIDEIDHRGVAGRFVEFDGDIGLIIGGGGASLCIFDAIRNYSGSPANYCEIGGNPTVTKVKRLAKLLLTKPGVKGIGVITNVLSNTRVDLIARGVILAFMELGIDIGNYPIVFRSAGSYEKDGYKILDKYGIKYLDRTHSMDEAAEYVVNMRKRIGD
ncbi:MAG: acetate--CoA ligase family protein [Deltaproteobacteria bacterium]|nr:acetate--CoA ligase family protein [Deltaproteobacteria bacterium]